MSKTYILTAILFISLVLAVCGGGGSANGKGPTEGHYVGELLSTDIDQTLAYMRKFMVEFDVVSGNQETWLTDFGLRLHSTFSADDH